MHPSPASWACVQSFAAACVRRASQLFPIAAKCGLGGGVRQNVDAYANLHTNLLRYQYAVIR